MSPLVTTFTTWLLTGTLLALGSRILLRLRSVTTAFSAAWHEEHDVRLCARAVAAGRNLDAAAAYLASRHPQHARSLEDAAAELNNALQPAALPVPPLGAAGRCRSDGPRRLVASPHLEHHQGQPVPWPNWTLRWERSDTP